MLRTIPPPLPDDPELPDSEHPWRTTILPPMPAPVPRASEIRPQPLRARTPSDFTAGWIDALLNEPGFNCVDDDDDDDDRHETAEPISEAPPTWRSRVG